MTQRHFVGWMLVASMIVFVIALAFGYNHDFQQALYTIVGTGWLIFGTWAAVLLLKSKR